MTPAGLYIGACKGLVVCKGLVLDCSIRKNVGELPPQLGSLDISREVAMCIGFNSNRRSVSFGDLGAQSCIIPLMWQCSKR